MEITQIILAIDPGSKKSGIVILENDQLLKGDNIENEDLFSLIFRYSNHLMNHRLMVVYEDIRPYTSRFNMDTIDTCKLIGRLEYVLKQLRIPFRHVTRNEVKTYVFNQYSEVAIPEIEKKIAKKNKVRLSGKPYKPSFHYVDDRIVSKAMKVRWNLGTPKPGKTNKIGIKEHAWQALGCLAWLLHKEDAMMKGIA